ncbi:CAAX prenyl protease 2 isoform X2 [Schistocerca americana]|uniref:CAAX prenyl protease 2 isoform X2 n=1 Tax=Schistocerca americana TaxID=7009 RepID=UPI001F4F308F|nr:CAAX prenyl protease 2 isoform X2 [Schistocerca americana]
MEDRRMKEYACISSIVACFLLSVVYVASLYVWNSPHNRDHPSTIKKRFLSVFIMMFVSPLFLYSFSREGILKKASIWELLGLRWQGLFPAAVIPLLLTMLLFLGPICMQGFSGLWKLYAEPRYWLANAQNLIWLRNHVVAPLSEEFTFRACMLPLLLQCFRPMTAVFVCPLFFGVAHFHHMVERMKTGLDFRHALMISCFQFAYTTLFGAYSAFLFARTGTKMSKKVKKITHFALEGLMKDNNRTRELKHPIVSETQMQVNSIEEQPSSPHSEIIKKTGA